MKTSNSRRHDSRRYVQELAYATGTNMHTKLQERQLLIGNKYSAPRRYGQNSNMHALEWHSGRESSCHWKSGITTGIIIAFHNSGRTWSVMPNYDMSKYYSKTHIIRRRTCAQCHTKLVITRLFRGHACRAYRPPEL